MEIVGIGVVHHNKISKFTLPKGSCGETLTRCKSVVMVAAFFFHLRSGPMIRARMLMWSSARSHPCNCSELAEIPLPLEISNGSCLAVIFTSTDFALYHQTKSAKLPASFQWFALWLWQLCICLFCRHCLRVQHKTFCLWHHALRSRGNLCRALLGEPSVSQCLVAEIPGV